MERLLSDELTDAIVQYIRNSLQDQQQGPGVDGVCADPTAGGERSVPQGPGTDSKGVGGRRNVIRKATDAVLNATISP